MNKKIMIFIIFHVWISILYLMYLTSILNLTNLELSKLNSMNVPYTLFREGLSVSYAMNTKFSKFYV